MKYTFIYLNHIIYHSIGRTTLMYNMKNKFIAIGNYLLDYDYLVTLKSMACLRFNMTLALITFSYCQYFHIDRTRKKVKFKKKANMKCGWGERMMMIIMVVEKGTVCCANSRTTRKVLKIKMMIVVHLFLQIQITANAILMLQ